jgi:hypothetical protein
VSKRFHKEHSLGAFDFFSIVIWKANRAKSQIAHKLLNRVPRISNLESVCRRLTRDLYKSPNPESRLLLLMKEWNFALPMASAILSVCWPDDFTVYDYRVCDALERKGLGKFHHLNNLVRFGRIWEGYSDFKKKVSQATPKGLSVREQDRYLWGESSASQLMVNITHRFTKGSKMASKSSRAHTPPN